MSSVLLKNIATIVSGDISAPILAGDAILVAEGKILKVGMESELNLAQVDMTIDCRHHGHPWIIRFALPCCVGGLHPQAKADRISGK